MTDLPTAAEIDARISELRREARELRELQYKLERLGRRKAREEKRRNRSEELLERYLAGETLAAIGETEGLTRERVRQLIAEVDEKAAPKTQKIRQQEKVFLNFVERVKEVVPCTICGYWVLRRTRGKLTDNPTCSPRCAEDWRIARYHLSEKVRTQIQRSAANWVVNHPTHPSVTKERLTYSQKILAGEPIQSNGRWTIPGSQAAEVVKRLGIEAKREAKSA